MDKTETINKTNYIFLQSEQTMKYLRENLEDEGGWRQKVATEPVELKHTDLPEPFMAY
jgi:hypothetical protein